MLTPLQELYRLIPLLPLAALGMLDRVLWMRLLRIQNTALPSLIDLSVDEKRFADSFRLDSGASVPFKSKERSYPRATHDIKYSKSVSRSPPCRTSYG